LAKTVATTISISETLFGQAEQLAQDLNITPDRLFELALESYIASLQSPQSDENRVTLSAEQSLINQGDVYWVQFGDTEGSGSNISHPHVVIQANVLNHSRIQTVAACAVTTNMKRANLPGNILLEVGEANLPKQSIIEVSKVSTVDKAQLGAYVGTLSQQRVKQILAGMQFLQKAFFAGQ
jgi:mRNA interferase MazF